MVLGYVLVVLRGLKLTKIPGETSKNRAITTVNHYTVSQSAEGHQSGRLIHHSLYL